MAAKIDIAIEKLAKRIIKMASVVEEQLEIALEIMNLKNFEKLDLIFEKEKKTCRYKIKILKLSQKIFALLKPIASDLRLAMSVLKISQDLDRISDRTKNLAYLIKENEYDFSISTHLNIKEASSICREMLKLSIDSFIFRNTDYSEKVFALEKKMNESYRRNVAEIKRILSSKPEFSLKAFANFQLLENLERISDHAVNISEEVYFITENKIIDRDKSESQKKKENNSN